MRNVDSSSLWSSLPHDPRDPAHAALRASDRDRDALQQVLAEAYADGRLDHEEYDERSARLAATRTLGELPDLVVDLVPPVPARRGPSSELVLATPADLRRRAEARWRADLARAFATFLMPSLICSVIWAATMAGGYFWPMWVMLGTGINLIRTLVRRPGIVEEHVARLEKKQARELRKRELEG